LTNITHHGWSSSIMSVVFRSIERSKAQV